MLVSADSFSLFPFHTVQKPLLLKYLALKLYSQSEALIETQVQLAGNKTRRTMGLAWPLYDSVVI